MNQFKMNYAGGKIKPTVTNLKDYLYQIQTSEGINEFYITPLVNSYDEDLGYQFLDWTGYTDTSINYDRYDSLARFKIDLKNVADLDERLEYVSYSILRENIMIVITEDVGTIDNSIKKIVFNNLVCAFDNQGFYPKNKIYTVGHPTKFLDLCMSYGFRNLGVSFINEVNLDVSHLNSWWKVIWDDFIIIPYSSWIQLYHNFNSKYGYIYRGALP